MRDHAIVSPRFWTGETGQLLRKHHDAQRLALYLMTCPSSNMIGLYYLPMPTISHELSTPFEGVKRAIQKLKEVDFCDYDTHFESVFIYKMASYQIGEKLKATDNRIAMVERLLCSHSKSRLYNEFLKTYKKAYHLNLTLKTDLDGPPSKGVGRGFAQDQDQEQDQEQEKKPPKPPSGAAVEFPPSLRTDRFKSAWSEWESHRREIKEPLTPTSIKRQLKQMAEWGEPRAVAAIEFTIMKGWVGLKEPDLRNGKPFETRDDRILRDIREGLSHE